MSVRQCLYNALKAMAEERQAQKEAGCEQSLSVDTLMRHLLNSELKMIEHDVHNPFTLRQRGGNGLEYVYSPDMNVVRDELRKAGYVNRERNGWIHAATERPTAIMRTEGGMWAACVSSSSSGGAAPANRWRSIW